MNINPYILLAVGSFFAALYAAVIIFGWARTRRNRRVIRETRGISVVPTLILDDTIKDCPDCVTTVSLTANNFIDAEGQKIDMNQYTPFVAVGQSADLPNVVDGDLILKDKSGRVKYVFTLPDISKFK